MDTAFQLTKAWSDHEKLTAVLLVTPGIVLSTIYKNKTLVELQECVP